MKSTVKSVFSIGLLVAASMTAGAALADDVGAPTSAAGGVHSSPLAPSSSLPSSDGPMGRSDSISGDTISRSRSEGSGIRNITPGTGKFETPNGTPCVGSTGFGSSSVQPGHRC